MFDRAYILVCTYETEQECFGLNLFGVPKSMPWDISKITRRTGIFLKKTGKSPTIYCVYLAVSPPEEHLSLLAWGGKFPVQIIVKQYYKFSHIPKCASKNIVWRNQNGGIMVLRITAEQTLDLMTAFIICTSLDLNHLVNSLLGEMGKYIPRQRMEQKLILLDYSFKSLKGMISHNARKSQFVPEFMVKFGVIHDFITAARCRDTKLQQGGNTDFFSRYWNKFPLVIRDLKELEKVDGVFSNLMLGRVNHVFSRKHVIIFQQVATII